VYWVYYIDGIGRGVGEGTRFRVWWSIGLGVDVGGCGEWLCGGGYGGEIEWFLFDDVEG
jgi:hypothetical protein